MQNLTRQELDRLETSGAPRPPLFTGRWKGEHFYRGVKWEGHPGQLGLGKRHIVEGTYPSCTVRPDPRDVTEHEMKLARRRVA